MLTAGAHRDTAYLATTIAFDSIVFAITLFCTLSDAASARASSILQAIRWDGTLYFCIILSGNVVWMALTMYARVRLVPLPAFLSCLSDVAYMPAARAEVYELAVRIPYYSTPAH